MDEEKINNEHVRRIEGACGTAVIEVDQEGQNRIIVISAANSDLKSSDISESLLKSITNKKILLSQLESPITEVQKVFSRAKEQNFYTILNPAPASKIDDNFYKFIDLFIPNQFEAEYFTNIKVLDFASAVQAGKKLIDLGVGSALITRGEAGAVLVQKDFEKNFEAFKVRTVDTTAAGDAFCGALAVRLSEGFDLESSINFASAAGALSVQSKGATVSLPKRDSIMNLLTIKKGN
jgi:ribokinase